MSKVKWKRYTKLKPSLKPLFDNLPTPPEGKIFPPSDAEIKARAFAKREHKR